MNTNFVTTFDAENQANFPGIDNAYMVHSNIQDEANTVQFPISSAASSGAPKRIKVVLTEHKETSVPPIIHLQDIN